MDPMIPLALDDGTTLRAPAYATSTLPAGVLALDPAQPNWIATDNRGMRLLALFDGKTPLRDVVSTYAADAELDVARAWLHVETFARDALRQGFLSRDGVVPVPYLGRSAYLQTDRLAELWLHVNDFCNLTCAHCLVSSGPDRSQGLPTARLLDAIDQGVALGAQRFFFTGGEPLARPDALELGRRIVTEHERELVILTNGTLFSGERLDGLTALAGTACASRSASMVPRRRPTIPSEAPARSSASRKGFGRPSPPVSGPASRWCCCNGRWATWRRWSGSRRRSASATCISCGRTTAAAC